MNTEEIKFYNVEIGFLTRAGNLNVNHSFISKSDKNWLSVNQFYSFKYKGFAVRVTEIIEIATDEIPKSATDDPYYKSPDKLKVEELEKQVKSLKGGNAFDRFSGKLDKDLNLDIKLLFKEWKVLNEQYYQKRDEIKVLARKFIENKYSKENIDIYSVDMEDLKISDQYIPFTIRLSGKILPSDNIIDK